MTYMAVMTASQACYRRREFEAATIRNYSLTASVNCPVGYGREVKGRIRNRQQPSGMARRTRHGRLRRHRRCRVQFGRKPPLRQKTNALLAFLSRRVPQFQIRRALKGLLLNRRGEYCRSLLISTGAHQLDRLESTSPTSHGDSTPATSIPSGDDPSLSPEEEESQNSMAES